MSHKLSEGQRCVTFVLDAGDLIHTHRLTLRDKLKRFSTIMAMGALSLAGVSVFAGVALLTDGRVMLSDLLAMAIVPLVGIAMAIGLRWMLIPAAARRTLRESPVLRQPCRRAWSDDGFAAANIYGQGTVPWADLHGWAEDRNVIVIYESRGVAQVIPKRALTAEQADDLRRCAMQITASTNG